jgi:hypothetical protein
VAKVREIPAEHAELALALKSVTAADARAFARALGTTEKRRAAREAVNALADCVAASDVAAFGEAGERVDELCQWPAAFRAVLRVPPPNHRFRKHFLQYWIRHGDLFRRGVGNDLLLADGLRRLLPAYSGPPVTLWRGDSFYNRRHQTYGLSWTADEEVARSFMNGMCRRSEGGSVLLRTKASAEAVICSLGDHSGEAEYVVDRRRLSSVEVIERASQLPPGGRGRQARRPARAQREL